MSETAQGTLIAVEKSRSWPKILAGEIPDNVEVFLLFWRDRSSGRIVDYGCYLSTSEPGPVGTDPQIVCEVEVPVPASNGNQRTREDLLAVQAVAYDRYLARQLVLDPAKRLLFEELCRDLKSGYCKPKTRALPTDIVSPKEYEEFLSHGQQ
jgi:hypothetical protein